MTATDETFDPFGESVSDDDLFEAMDAQEQSEPWMPKEEGATIIGEVVSIGTVSSSFQPDLAIPRVTLKKADGTFASVTGYHTVLRLRMEEAAPQVGDRFAAKYFGEKTNNAGTRTFKSYGVKVARPGGTTPPVANPKGAPPAAIHREDDAPPY